MPITINLSPELEEILKEVAARTGKDADNYIVSMLEEKLLPGPGGLREREAELLQQINLGISPEEWRRFFQLVEQRDAEQLPREEYQELLDLTEAIESANARRMEHLVELSILRKVPLDELMEELGIQPVSNGNY
ncbi:MAG: hypothetical protein H6557_27265 [Lewinellaceae bacterium]|nr:hypothetical protein [Phaeodactylibacter sp.]MCB9040340.1 hypothetical protein [Lewinellaceae bacterium]